MIWFREIILSVFSWTRIPGVSDNKPSSITYPYSVFSHGWCTFHIHIYCEMRRVLVIGCVDRTWEYGCSDLRYSSWKIRFQYLYVARGNYAGSDCIVVTDDNPIRGCRGCCRASEGNRDIWLLKYSLWIMYFNLENKYPVSCLGVAITTRMGSRVTVQ